MRVSWNAGIAVWLLAGITAGNAQAPATPTQANPPPATAAEAPQRTYGISLLGAPSLPPDFKFFPYVNPDAPKGGEVALSDVGTFDSFNPFIVRGTAASDVFRVWDTLMMPKSARPRPSTASSQGDRAAGRPHGRRLRTAARGEVQRRHAGHRRGRGLDLRDLREKGRPFYRQYYADVASVTVEGPRRVVFHFKSNSTASCRSILGQMAVLPKHWWAGRDFDKPLTDPPLGSGAYRVGHFEFGRTLSLDRVPDVWSKDLPVMQGLVNFNTRRTEYFRDATVALEAFKAGQIDFRMENVAKEWATAYDFPAVQKGLVKKELLPHQCRPACRASA